MPLGWLGWLAATGGLGVNPIETVDRSLGDWALRFLLPNNPSLLYNLAEIHRERGDLARSRGCLQRALELAPDFAPAQTLLEAIDAQRG